MLASCSNRQNIDIKEIRDDFAKTANEFNDSIDRWEKKYKSISELSIDSPISALSKIDIELQSFNRNQSQKHDLLFLKANIYYQIDSLEESIRTLSSISSIDMAPKYLAARAGSYIKQKKFSEAFNDLNTASNINDSYRWNLGNYYEIRRQKDSAISNYQFLFQTDTTVYKYCLERITELSKKQPRFLTALIFRDRERLTLRFIPTK